MAINSNLENLMKNTVVKVNNLELATIFLTNKNELQQDLFDAALDIDTITRSIFSMRQNLNSMIIQNENCKEAINILHLLEDRIEHLKNNIPSSLIQVLVKVDNEVSEVQNKNFKKCHDTVSPKISNQLNDEIIDPSDYLSKITDCKKTLFTDSEDGNYNIDPINVDIFSKIPKYMIGRQTLATLNDFIVAINKVMKAKYNLLSLGKNKARKKGELELYLELKKEEADVCSGNERKYFFTVDDYQRVMNSKLDRTKLNLLTVLRHCRKIQELRSGKNVKYCVINTSR